MTTVVALVLAGVVLLAVEVLVPGAILGIAGSAFLLGGVIVAFAQFGVAVGSVTAVVAVVLLGLAVFIEFKVLPRSRLARAFSMTDTVAGTAGKPAAVDLVGRECVAVTKLRPSGYVTLGGLQYEAFCRAGAAEQGARLRVAAVDNFRLIVNPIEPQS